MCIRDSSPSAPDSFIIHRCVDVTRRKKVVTTTAVYNGPMTSEHKLFYCFYNQVKLNLNEFTRTVVVNTKMFKIEFIIKTYEIIIIINNSLQSCTIKSLKIHVSEA